MSTLNFTVGVSALLLIITVLVAGQEPLVEIQMTNSHAQPGEEVTIACRVENQGINSIVLMKSFKTPENTEVDAVIFAGPEMTKAPTATGRYRFDVITVGMTKILYKVSITNASAEDSGPYMCVLRGTSLVSEREFSVYHPVQELTFNNISIDHGFSVFVMNESATMDLDCMAKGSIPAADVSIFLGDEELTNPKTKKMTSSDLYCTDVSETCLIYETFNKNAVINDFRVSYKDHNKDLKCVTKIPGSNFPPREAVFKLHVPFAPKFECDFTTLTRLHEASVKVSCDIVSNPANPDFIFEFMWGGEMQHLRNNDQTSDGEIKAGQTPKEDGRMEVFLIIKKVSKRHFMEFSLKTNNSIGSNTATLKLSEDNTVNAANINSFSAFFAVLFVLLRTIL